MDKLRTCHSVDDGSGDVLEAVEQGGKLVVLEQQTAVFVFGSLSLSKEVKVLRVEKGWISLAQ